MSANETGDDEVRVKRMAEAMRALDVFGEDADWFDRLARVALSAAKQEEKSLPSTLDSA